ncbi:ATP-dependent RNA helicase eIF4A [Penicillium atrosanguineum]|uniref:ATP-dependent RNA helicase eIF4A n=1 Tax=Penicillium atrosanguineum TaxID=1132637 RepID=UPI0023862778|nr:ATP-dependent RNA helicase eIF4A [Penicillium atrosanguineum]KAJ5297146.1 ATP-dependent RNA helicase eIF4A [Penicillium atrosanguineum]
MTSSHIIKLMKAAIVSFLIGTSDWTERTNPDQWNRIEFMDLVSKEVRAPLEEITVPPEQCPRDTFTVPIHVERLPEDRAKLGHLAMLPNDILAGIILPTMDYVSVSRFCQTCSFAYRLVARNNEYRVLLAQVPKIFPVLRALRLHLRVSLKDILLELHQSKCRGCGENGTNIFLPTVERVCSNCLRYNQGFWTIYLQEAQRCFNLENRDLARIPRFRDLFNLFDLYAVPYFPLEPARHRAFVAVRSALQQALKVHGSAEAIDVMAEAQLLDPTNPSSTSQQVETHLYAHLRQATLGTLPRDPTQPPPTEPPKDVRYNTIVAEITDRAYHNTANVSFPYVLRGHSEAVQLYTCKGCAGIVDRFKVMPNHREYMRIPNWCGEADIRRKMVGATFITYTEAELVEHARSCLGAGLRMYRYQLLENHPGGLGSEF